MRLGVKLIGAKAVAKSLRDLSRASSKAVATALNKTAWDARDEWIRELKKTLHKPTGFTTSKRGVWIRKAYANKLTATIQVATTQASYLKNVVYGSPRKGRFPVPYKHFNLDPHGNMPKGRAPYGPKEANQFYATIKGTYGLWQREGRGVKLLAGWERKAEYEAIVPFHEIVDRVVDKRFRYQLEKQLQRLLTR